MCYVGAVRGNLAKAFELANPRVFRRAPLLKSDTDFFGTSYFLLKVRVDVATNLTCSRRKSA